MTNNSVQTMLVYQDQQWVYADVEADANAMRFHQIKFYYANLIDYARVVMCLLAVFTIGLNWPFCTAILVVGSVLLDWVDGPVARAYHQCTIFGSGLDWLADVLAQVVLMVWLGQLAPGALPWLMLATSVEIAAAIFDFAVTATAMYPKLGSPGGLFILLRWSQANGTYTAWGTFLWLSYPLLIAALCLDLSWPVQAPLTAFILRSCTYVLFVPAILYILCEATYLAFILKHWTEATYKPPGGKRAEGQDGFEFLGTVPQAQQELLSTILEETTRILQTRWDESLAQKQIFWVNLWQRSGEGKKLGVARIDELDAWVRQLTKSIYAGEDIILDGYGFIVNPTGTKSQPWHIDYALDYATLYVPMSPLTPDNAIQYVVLPPTLSADAYARATTDRDHINFDELLRHSDFVSVRQMLASPFSITKMDFGTIHRGIANTGDFDRTLFWISVKKGSELLPAEPLVEVFGNY